MAADRPPREQTLLTDDELRRRVMAKPDVRARAEEALKRTNHGEAHGPGITEDELPDFLRERDKQ